MINSFEIKSQIEAWHLKFLRLQIKKIIAQALEIALTKPAASMWASEPGRGEGKRFNTLCNWSHLVSFLKYKILIKIAS